MSVLSVYEYRSTQSIRLPTRGVLSEYRAPTGYVRESTIDESVYLRVSPMVYVVYPSPHSLRVSSVYILVLVSLYTYTYNVYGI